ncbi:MAG: diaminopimelate epimerase [Desulfobacteraceae bacterium]|nr:diaminopimelate epimerase [Desulfobacteraceae bacterium]MBC2756065.1 diaminopimelate epimerase [Desulfobacteraceae bacterium]
MKFYKYHGLGNDYIVIDPADHSGELTKSEILIICHRNFGIGSDGILLGPIQAETADFAVRIFNPDGSEAEKSGNGLRIFARYLYDKKRVSNAPFTISTIGGMVESRIHENGLISVDMGNVSFESEKIPVTGPKRKVLNDRIEIDGQEITYCGATIGNPHCVIISDDISPELAKKLGPKLETHPNFPNRTNVQFMKIIDRSNIEIEIWERGAGYTLASGSSSSASAAIAFALGYTDPDMTVHMPGGTLKIRVHQDLSITLTGPVTRVGEGTIDAEIFQQDLKSTN